MTDRERLYSGLSNAAWGYFLVHFNFNLNFGGSSINILPEFVGFYLLFTAIGKLSSERRDLLLLRPLCILLAAWHGMKWGLAILRNSLDDTRFLFLGLIVMAATLYFHFQFLTDMAALAEKYQPKPDQEQPQGYGLDGRIRHRRTAMLVLTTAADLMGDAAQFLRNEDQAEMLAVAGVCLAIVLLIVVVLIMSSLFQLRRFVRETETPAASE